ncbi:hypothetical protein [Pantoea agglomerans]|uniref:hypothetical protein n=1 Tax=Enterobacter agglomerans TaxID=549 RepID=UPI0013D23C8B|nr:hypothetical protein [Pantoea agglomerans]
MKNNLCVGGNDAANSTDGCGEYAQHIFLINFIRSVISHNASTAVKQFVEKFKAKVALNQHNVYLTVACDTPAFTKNERPVKALIAGKLRADVIGVKK